ncbi:MAG: glycosyltransferase family 4 protein [Candidatus Hydrogenedentes bacterium]|nr:glycosyltransferase family 4 protein [Candidatus Hydrogenedentota bacterium]
MTSAKPRIALDLSCAAESPVTGIGYAAINQVKALLAGDSAFAYASFATGDRQGGAVLRRELGMLHHRVLPFARLAKYHLWTRWSWPPIEWFSGDVRIAHNFCHQTPATRNALKLVTIHDLSFIRVPETHTETTIRVQSRLLKQCVEEADALIAVSNHCKSELIELLGIDAARVHVVPNGVNLEEFEKPFDPQEHARLARRVGLTRDYLIQIGTLEPRKNILRLLEAYGVARSRHPHSHSPQLLLVGKMGWKSGPIAEAIASRTSGADVIHAGYLNRSEAVLLLRGARACLYPSLYEGFGLPVLEAMAAGIPVVTSAVSALPEVAGGTCTLVDPYDVESIASAICSVMDNEEAAARLAAAARERARTLTWETSASALEKVYCQVAGMPV